MKNLGLVELLDMKRQKESALWTLGFKLAPRELFDTIVELEREIELRVEQIQELKKLTVLEILPGLDQATIDEIYDLIERKEFDKWIMD